MSSNVYLVIHRKLPTYSMYLDNVPYSEPIETVNVKVVGVYGTEAKAEEAARNYFMETLELTDNGESENGGYYCSADGMEDSDSGTWHEEVFVQCKKLK
jgi:hypothetical protein